jgi:hypothetical protein
MPFPKSTAYPAAATNAAWQKKKSLTDKNVKTKVGPALVTAADKWADIEFGDLKLPAKWSTVKAAEDALDKATEAWKGVVAARAALKAAITVTKTQSTNSKLSSASRTALKAILKDLEEADNRLELMDDILPALQVDVQITKKDEAEAKRKRQALEAAALNKLTDVEVKHGSTLIYSGGAGKLQKDNTYEIMGGTLKVSFDVGMSTLQKKVKVSAKDDLGRDFAKEMKLAGLRGDDMIRLE